MAHPRRTRFLIASLILAGAGICIAQTNTPQTSVNITVDVLRDRHRISPYVYGVNFPPDTNYIQQTGATAIRWGGNATSRYNWENFDTNAASDWYFQNRSAGDGPLYKDSIQFVSNIAAAGAFPIMTMPMLSWVAKDGGSYSFSVAKYGAQCAVNPYNSDDGNGMKPDCQTPITGNDPNDAHVPLLDQPGQHDPQGSVHRNQWVAALKNAFGSVPHFYDMDNEFDIWGSTHRDVHPNPAGYDEMRDVFLTEARVVKSWDAKALRLGPVSCCWWFYWNGANNNDKAAHGGEDFMPWWLNQVVWSDKVVGTRSVDVFDFHAYPDSPDTSGWTKSQKQALGLRILRDWWDPAYKSESWIGSDQWATQIQPRRNYPTRIPRLRAIVNSTYPGTSMAITEWNASIAGESDFSTALVDADAWGILGRERVYASTRWVAADPANPNHLALTLYRNYDGQHDSFGVESVSAMHDADPNLFSSYASVSGNGKTMTLLVLDKDPQATAATQIALNGFSPSKVTTYTLSSANPNQIVASSQQSWNSSWSFAPYSATLLVVKGGLAQTPEAEWDPNPDTTMVPSGKKVVLHPKIVSGSGSVTLTAAQSDSGISVTLTRPTLSPGQKGAVTVTAGNTPGFYHYSLTGTDDAGVTQKQGGWIVVGNPPATLSKQGDKQGGPPGSKLNLSVTLNAGQSGGNAQGASVFFTADAGSLSSRIVNADSSGKASVVLTLPNQPGKVHVTAEAPVSLGHAVVTFAETAK
jgi:hypothetical protein